MGVAGGRCGDCGRGVLAAPNLFKNDGDGFLRVGPQPDPNAQPAPVSDADTDVGAELPAGRCHQACRTGQAGRHAVRLLHPASGQGSGDVGCGAGRQRARRRPAPGQGRSAARAGRAGRPPGTGSGAGADHGGGYCRHHCTGPIAGAGRRAPGSRGGTTEAGCSCHCGRACRKPLLRQLPPRRQQSRPTTCVTSCRPAPSGRRAMRKPPRPSWL